MAPTDLSAWEFLWLKFGLTDEKNIVCYLDILQTIGRDDYDGRCGEAAPAQAFDLYKLLYQKVGGTAMDKGLEYLRLVLINPEINQRLT